MTLERLLVLIALIASCFRPDMLVAQQDEGEPQFHTRGVSQQHAEELRNAVIEAARRVNSSGSVPERSRWQEELCKRLIQTEDYANALQVAHAVYLSEGADPERRAVHHFLVARIYRMMMDSASDPTAMEDARQLALKTARQVQLKRYPSSWGIGAAAEQLQRELSSQTTIAAAEFAASKRSQGGVDMRQAEAARAQTAAMEAAIYGRHGGVRVATEFASPPSAGPPSGSAEGSRRPMRAVEDDGTEMMVSGSGQGMSRKEILGRLQRGRADQAGESIPGGLLGPRNSRSDVATSAEAGNRVAKGSYAGDFPDFGTSGGRHLGAPVLDAGASIRNGREGGTGSGSRLLREEERSLLGPQRMGQTGAVGALAARGGVDPELSSSSPYIPGGVNRPYSLRGEQPNSPMRVATPALNGGRQTGAYRSAASATGTSRRADAETRSEMIRFNWSETKPGPGAAVENAVSRFSGPVIIDGRSGRPASVRTGASFTVRQ